uniref:S-like RNase n=1 Tax=Volvox carteri TaxID=3067 RepID=Q9MB72_VOLCA|nr:S-like RNase [Volvox carteri f. nagariensis]
MVSCLRLLALTSLLCIASGARPLSSISWSGDATSSAIPTAQRDFDYFMFVRQWAGSFCSTHACPLVPNRGFHFTIHGLWPNYSNGSWPQFCTPEDKFDEDQLEDLMDDLEVEWPSVYDSDETFWEHEWSKHGTCALDIFPSEHSYFGHILKLHWRYDLSAALRRADIVPSRTSVYRTKDLIAAIEDMYGARPLVHCGRKRQLSEIWMCLDKDLKAFDCDTSQEGNACQEVVIPPFKSRLDVDQLSSKDEEERDGVQ